MNERQPLENPEQQTNYEDIKEQKKLTNHKVICANQMISCSTQVDDDDSFFIESPEKKNKKKKKQQYKKRKKQKKRIQEKSAKICLAEMIQKIYAGKSSFQDQRNNIEICLWHLVGGNKFHDFLNQTIKLHVNSIQKQIWDYMNKLLRQNFMEKTQESIEFYLEMIERIYYEYLELKQSSGDIQKIINLFMKMTSGSQFQETHGLDKSTFRFMIQTNETIKNMVQMCTYKISSKHEKQFYHLKEIYQIINRQEDYDYEYENEDYAMQRSTEVDEEQILEREKILKPKRKRKKVKQSEFNVECQDVVRRLNEMVIEDKQRYRCNTSKKWLDSLKEKLVID